MTAELKLRFKALATGNEGVTVEARVTSANADAIDAEGADEIPTSRISGAATGDEHTLRSTGVDVSLGGTDAQVTVVDNADNDYATFEIELDVTAFDQDVFVPVNSASTTWKLVDGDGNDISVAAASTTVVIESSADEGGAGDAFFQINEGETETITVTVTYTPGNATPQTARLQLLTLVFDETGTVTGADDSTWSALPANTYRTSTKTIQD